MNDDAQPHIQNVGARTVVGAGWLVVWRFVTRCLGLASTLVLARLLVPADFGLIAMATTFAAAIDSMSSLGLQEALLRRPDTRRTWYPTAFAIQVARGVLTGSIIALGAHASSQWFNEPRLTPVLLVLAALALANGFENVAIVEFRRRLQFGMEFKLLFVPRILQFVVTIACAWLIESYWALLIGMVTSAVSRLAMGYIVRPWRPSFSFDHWQDLLSFSAWSWATGMARLVWERCDTFILAPVMGSGPFGIYLIAFEIAILPVTELVAPAGRALYAGLSVKQHQGDKITDTVLPVIAVLLTFVVPLSIGLSATSGYIVTGLLGPNWEAARPMISTFAWLCCIAPVAWICSSVLVAQGLWRRNFLSTACAAAFKVVMMIAVVYSGQVALAPIAVLICVAVEAILFLAQLRGAETPQWRRNLGGFFRIGISAGLSVVVLLSADLGWGQVTMSPLLAVLSGGSLGAAIIAGGIGAQVVLWRIAGCPAGPERWVVDNVIQTLRIKIASVRLGSGA